jgi:hypothetical protein
MKAKQLITMAGMFISSAIFSQDCYFYYPEMVGAQLVYKHYDKKEKLVSTVSQQVTDYKKTVAGAEATILVKSYDSKDKLTGENTLQVKCEAGIFYFDMEGYLSPETMSAYQDMEVKVNSTNLEVPGIIKVGDKLKDGSLTMDISTNGFKFMTMTVFITDRTVEAEESVTTPAGTFPCFKLSQTVAIKAGFKMTTKSYDWLSVGVGTVKNESYTTDGDLNSRMELTDIKK